MIDWHDLFNALALVIIFEGIMPFLSPDRFRKVLEVANQLSNEQLRKVGGIFMSIGLLVLYLVNQSGA